MPNSIAVRDLLRRLGTGFDWRCLSWTKFVWGCVCVRVGFVFSFVVDTCCLVRGALCERALCESALCERALCERAVCECALCECSVRCVNVRYVNVLFVDVVLFVFFLSFWMWVFVSYP